MKKIIFLIIAVSIIAGCKEEKPVTYEKTVSVKQKIESAVNQYGKDNFTGYEPVEFKPPQKVTEGWEVYHTYTFLKDNKQETKSAWFKLNGLYEVIHVTFHNPPE